MFFFPFNLRFKFVVNHVHCLDSVLCVACCSLFCGQCLWMTANHFIHNIPGSPSVSDICFRAKNQIYKSEIRPAAMKLNLPQPFLSLSLSLLRSSLTVKKINRWLDWQDVGMLLVTPLDPSDPCHKWSCDHPQQKAKAAALTTCWSFRHIRRYSAMWTHFLVYLGDEERVWTRFVSLWHKTSGFLKKCRIR